MIVISNMSYLLYKKAETKRAMVRIINDSNKSHLEKTRINDKQLKRNFII